jgi:transcriptional repressor NrdR
VNKNAVPNDPRPPFVHQRLRIGTPAATTRGFKEGEVLELANWIADVLDENLSDGPCVAKVQGESDRDAVGGSRSTRTDALPFCNHEETKSSTRGCAEKDSRSAAARGLHCGERFHTFETAELVMPRIVKNDESREPFDESKLRNSMSKALEKRPVSSEALDAAVVHILPQAARAWRAEVEFALSVAELAMEELHNLDESRTCALHRCIAASRTRRVPRRDRAHWISRRGKTDEVSSRVDRPERGKKR